MPPVHVEQRKVLLLDDSVNGHHDRQERVEGALFQLLDQPQPDEFAVLPENGVRQQLSGGGRRRGDNDKVALAHNLVFPVDFPDVLLIVPDDFTDSAVVGDVEIAVEIRGQ